MTDDQDQSARQDGEKTDPITLALSKPSSWGPTLLNGKPTEVWCIPGKKPSFPDVWRSNNSTPELWVRFDPEAPFWQKDGWVPFLSGHNSRMCWKEEIEEDHYIKTKWGESSLVRTVRWRLSLNGMLLSTGGALSPESASTFIEMRKITIGEHPILFHAGWADEIGRRVYYHDQPAVLCHIDPADDRIGVRYVGGSQVDLRGNTIEGFNMLNQRDVDNAEVDDDSIWPGEEWHGNVEVYDALWGIKSVDWFREKLYPGDTPDE